MLRDNDHRRPGPVRRRRGRLRVRARRQPPGHQLAAGHQRLRPARRHRRRGVRHDRADFVELPEDPEAHVVELLERLRDADGTRAGRRRSARSCRRRWTPTCRSSAPRRRSSQALSDIARAQGALPARRRPGQGQALQHRPARGRRARLPARPRRGHGRRRPWPARSPAAATSARTTRPRRRELHAAHHGVPGDHAPADGPQASTAEHPARLQAGRP